MKKKKLLKSICLATAMSLTLSSFPGKIRAESFNQSSIQGMQNLKEQSSYSEGSIVYIDENVKITFVNVSGIGLKYNANFIVENISNKALYVWINEMSINGISIQPYNCSTQIIKMQEEKNVYGEIKKEDAANIPRSQVRSIDVKFAILGYNDSGIDYNTNNISISALPTSPYQEPHVHTYWTVGVVQEATCESPGMIKYVCEYCEDVYMGEIPPNGHRPNNIKSKSPTALETGYKKKICIDCKKVVEEEILPKLKASVKLTKNKLILKKGKTYSLKTKKITFGDKVKKWTSSKPNVASVNKKTGKVKALKKGKTKITLTMKSRCNATCIVTVK